MASVQLQDIHKTYPNGHVAVRGIDLKIADGELLVLVGPSGCGKSTVLRTIAGLESPTHGRVLIGDRDVTSLPPQDRDVAMMFQNYALYPHKTVRDNLAFGLRMRGVRSGLIAERVQRVARSLELEQVLDRKPAQLSGGQRQRVALGRAIVREPRAFLLDEPLSNLDAKLRVQTRAELARLHRQLKTTMIYVTHDQEEAMTLGDRIAVLLDGRLQQLGPPLEVYRRPASSFVAGFIGSPAMNFFPCTLSQRGGKIRLESPVISLEIATTHHSPLTTHHSVLLGIRSHDIRLVAPSEADVRGRIDVIEPLGSELLIHLVTGESGGEADITLMAAADTAVAVGDPAGVRFERDRLHLFDAKTTRRIE